MICAEISGSKGLTPIIAAAQYAASGKTVDLVDGDLMGRAFPELQMVLPSIRFEERASRPSRAKTSTARRRCWRPRRAMRPRTTRRRRASSAWNTGKKGYNSDFDKNGCTSLKGC